MLPGLASYNANDAAEGSSDTSDSEASVSCDSHEPPELQVESSATTARLEERGPSTGGRSGLLQTPHRGAMPATSSANIFRGPPVSGPACVSESGKPGRRPPDATKRSRPSSWSAGLPEGVDLDGAAHPNTKRQAYPWQPLSAEACLVADEAMASGPVTGGRLLDVPSPAVPTHKAASGGKHETAAPLRSGFPAERSSKTTGLRPSPHEGDLCDDGHTTASAAEVPTLSAAATGDSGVCAPGGKPHPHKSGRKLPPPPPRGVLSGRGRRGPPSTIAKSSGSGRHGVAERAGFGASSVPSRQRVFEHVEGNWPALVYVRVGAEDAGSLCKQFSTVFAAALESGSRQLAEGGTATRDKREGAPSSDFDEKVWRLDEDPSASLPVHVSLSRTFTLRKHQIEPFIDDLRKSVANHRSFVACLDAPHVFMNDNMTRTFFGAAVGAGQEQFLGLIHKVDTVMQAHSLPPFYDDPIPHASLCWVGGDRRPEILRSAPSLSPGTRGTTSLAGASERNAAERLEGRCFPTDWLEGSEGDMAATIEVDSVWVKVGNRSFLLKLQPGD